LKIQITPFFGSKPDVAAGASITMRLDYDKSRRIN